jgi:hypothetical protein
MRIFFILGLALAVSEPAPVPEDCGTLLVKLQATIGADPSEGERVGGYTVAPSLEMIAWRPGKHGGRILTFRKIGMHWGSSMISIGQDPQGDPRWITYLLGARAAEVLGVKVIGNTIEIPDSTEVIGAMAKVEARLKAMGKAPLGTGFYDQERTSYTEYNERQGRNELPLAKMKYEGLADGTVKVATPTDFGHYLHDLSFHSGAMFMPNEAAAYFAASVRYGNDLAAHFESRDPNEFIVADREKLKALGERLKAAQEAKETTEAKKAAVRAREPVEYAKKVLARAMVMEVKRHVTNKIDLSTGFVAPSLVNWAHESKRNPAADPQVAYRHVFEKYLQHGKSTSWELQNLFAFTTFDTNSYASSAHIENHYGIREQLGQFLSLAAVSKIERDFAATYRSTNPLFDPAKPATDYEARVKKYCTEILERRQDVIEALNSLP